MEDTFAAVDKDSYMKLFRKFQLGNFFTFRSLDILAFVDSYNSCHQRIVHPFVVVAGIPCLDNIVLDQSSFVGEIADCNNLGSVDHIDLVVVLHNVDYVVDFVYSYAEVFALEHFGGAY